MRSANGLDCRAIVWLPKHLLLFVEQRLVGGHSRRRSPHGSVLRERATKLALAFLRNASQPALLVQEVLRLPLLLIEQRLQRQFCRLGAGAGDLRELRREVEVLLRGGAHDESIIRTTCWSSRGHAPA